MTKEEMKAAAYRKFDKMTQEQRLEALDLLANDCRDEASYIESLLLQYLEEKMESAEFVALCDGLYNMEVL